MPRVRGNGDGTVTKRHTPAGVRYQMAIYDADGKRHFRYFKTEREANAARRVALKERDEGRPVKPERHTLGELFDAWLDSLKAQVDRGERSLATWRQYESHVRMHLKPALGAIECRTLSVKQVEDYLNRLTLSPKTRTSHRIALRRALNVAKRWGWVQSNVVAQTDPISLPRREVPALSLADAQQLMERLHDDPLWSVYATALHTGLRVGELAGLAVEHINLDAGTARICQQVQRVPGQGLVVKGLKSRASNATIPLTPQIVPVLREQIRGRSSGLIWTTKSDRPYDPTHLTHRFQAALTAAGLPKMPLHHLRHYFVSFLPALDVHPAVAQKLARHASATTTLTIYTSVEDAGQRDAVNRLHAALTRVAIAADVPTDVREPRLGESSQAHA
jgi:integrase